MSGGASDSGSKAFCAVPLQAVTVPLGVSGVGFGSREAIPTKGVRAREMVVFGSAIFMRQWRWRVLRGHEVAARVSCAKD